MAGKTVLILGGGWGGIAAAHTLRGLLPPEHRVVVIERRDTFSLCMSNLWIMTGDRKNPAEIERPMSRLAREGIEWVRGEVRRIEPESKVVHTDSQTLEGDYLLIALGAESVPREVPGLVEAAHNLYARPGVVALRQAIEEFGGGKVAVLISRTPFRCPAAPYEAAFLLDSAFRKRGIRERVEMAIYTPERQPMPVAGPSMGEALRQMLAERNINYFPEHTLSSIDPTSRRILFDGREAPYDLLVGVPPHRAPRVVAEAALIDSTGYIPVHPQTLQVLSDPETLQTRYPGVFAIGDITSIRLLNGMLLPKAGAFAEEEGRVAARNIAAEIVNGQERVNYDGRGFCYVEVGEGMAAYASGNFYAYPGPRLYLESPSTRYRQEKEEMERVLDTWFVR